MPELFDNKSARKAKDIEKEKDRLYQQIGKLQVEVEFLKKTRAIVTHHGVCNYAVLRTTVL